MSFTIELGYTDSPENAINKNFHVVFTLNSILKDECSVTNPVIQVRRAGSDTTTMDMSILCCCNYMHIGEFRRYYFIEPPKVIRNVIAEIHGHVDVLKTFRSQILQNIGLILRASQKSLYDKFLVDEKIKIRNSPKIVVKRFKGESFEDNPQFVLAVSGGGGGTSESSGGGHSFAKENTFNIEESEVSNNE